MLFILSLGCRVAPPLAAMVDWVTGLPGGHLGPMRLATSELGDGGGAYATRALLDGEVLHLDSGS